MIRSNHPSSRQFAGAAVFAALAWALLVSGTPGAGVAESGKERLAPPGEATADIKFATLKPYAVVQQEPGKARRLCAVGDVLADPRNPKRSVVVQRVISGGIVVRESSTGLERSLRPGDLVPGLPELTFVKTVMLDLLQYRFKVVEHVTQSEAVLVSLLGSRAVLEKEILRAVTLPAPPDPPAQGTPLPSANAHTRDPDLLANVRVEEIDANNYALSAADLKPVIESVGQVFAGLGPAAAPALASLTGTSFNMTSAAGDATITRSGFTVTNLRVAQFFGIHVGDTITSLNGLPVNSPLNAWWTFQEIFVNNPHLTDLRVDLIRGGKQSTNTYRIR